MQTIRLTIGGSSLSLDNSANNNSISNANTGARNGSKFVRNISKDFNSEGLLESFESLKQNLEVFLRDQISSSVEDERSDLKNFRISFVIKSKTNKKPSPLRNQADFSSLVELVKSEEEGKVLVIRMDLKKKKAPIRNKRNFEDEEIEAKKNQIKCLQDEIESKRKELKHLHIELQEMYQNKSSENQLVGLMSKITLNQTKKSHFKPKYDTKKMKFKK